MDQIEIKSLIPNFLEFYHYAKDEGNANKRWDLWRKYYNFAAVPPGNEGQKMARKLLDEAWMEYHDIIGDLKNGEPDQSLLKSYLSRIKDLMNYTEPINDVIILYFIGGFEGNTFVAPAGETKIAMCIPVESEISNIVFAHELTHIVHAKKAHFSGKAERQIASIILQEGLATRVSQLIVPDKKDESYVEFETGWLEQCISNEKEIFEGVLPYLQASDINTVNKFTIGIGITGIEREAYFIGWKLVGYLLEKDKDIAELAAMKEDEIVSYVNEALNIYLEEKHYHGNTKVK